MFLLEYRGLRAIDDGLWGPFSSRSAASDFAGVLGATGAAWSVVSLRDPDTYTFPES